LLRLAEASDSPCREVKDLAGAHLAAVRAKIADLRAMQQALAALIAQCEARGDGAAQPGCPLIETLLPARGRPSRTVALAGTM
jgi:MerR family mercuric resistance operon transcriptional regulator